MSYIIVVLRVGVVGWVVFSRVFYKRWLGSWFPFVEFLGPEGRGAFLLWGFHWFVFGGRRCWLCGRNIPSDNSLGLCDECYFSWRGLRVRLFVEGYDRVYSPELRSVFSGVLDRRFYLYVGAFGSLYKVGIVVADRFGSGHGFVGRLVEQGFDVVAVFDGGFDIFRAQDLERDVARSFGLRDRLGFREKLDALFSGVDVREFLGLVEDVRDFVGGDVVFLRRFRWGSPRDFDSVFRGGELLGSGVFRRGNVYVVRNCSEVLAVNLHDFVGREVLVWEV